MVEDKEVKKEERKLNVFGRPIEYDPIRTIERAQAYLDNPISVSGKTTFPSLEGLAVFLKIGRSTVYEWAKSYPEFSDITEAILVRQAAMLQENGLDKSWDSGVTRLILGKHGYKDQTDITTNNKEITVENQAAANIAIANFLNKKNGTTTDTPEQPKE